MAEFMNLNSNRTLSLAEFSDMCYGLDPDLTLADTQSLYELLNYQDRAGVTAHNFVVVMMAFAPRELWDATDTIKLSAPAFSKKTRLSGRPQNPVSAAESMHTADVLLQQSMQSLVSIEYPSSQARPLSRSSDKEDEDSVA